MSKMMTIKMNEADDLSYWTDDDQSMSPMLCPKTEDQQSGKVGKKQVKRKPKSNGVDNEVGSMKRKLTDGQAARLELYFVSEPRLETERKERVAAELELEPRQVAVWFQNRRARWKCKKLEDDFETLRISHHSAMAHKAPLEAHVSELNEKLMEAEGEIQRLSSRFEERMKIHDNMSTTPASSSMSAEQVGMFPNEVMQQLENEYNQMMDYCWMSNNINS